MKFRHSVIHSFTDLGVGCEKIKFGFLVAAWAWTVMLVPHGDVMVEKYKLLADTGIVR